MSNAENEAAGVPDTRDPNDMSARVRKILTNTGAKKINDEDYLKDREGWRIQRDAKLGGGKFATFYKAKASNGAECAVKITPFSDLPVKLKQNLQSVAVKILRYIQENAHESIIEIYELYLTSSKLYVFCEVLHGDLEMFCKKKKSQEEAIKVWIISILNGLQYLYENCIGHRRLTPGNCILVETKDRVKLSGFTYSMITWNAETQQPIRAEKESSKDYQHHFAPEVTKGEYDPHTADIFALGCLIINLLTRKHAFEKKTKDYLDTCKTHLRRSDVTISDGLECFLGRCLADKPLERANVMELQSHHWVTGGAENHKSQTGKSGTG